MRIPTIYLALLSLFTVFYPVKAQTNSPQGEATSDTKTWIEVLGIVSNTDRTPFWLQSNQWGIVPRTGKAASLRLGGQGIWQLGENEKGNWKAIAGLEVVGNAAQKTQLLLPEAYAGVRYRHWELVAGRRKQQIGIADSTLGIGPYAISGNAMPIPEVRIGTTTFVPIPFTKGWLKFLATYSEGWFESGRPITSELKLHRKQLYLKLGKPEGQVQLYGGLNNMVQWGGKTPYFTVGGQMPRGFREYLFMVLGEPSYFRLDTTKTDFFDNTNRVGNHVGSLDLALELNTYGANWLFYRQNIYEDGSMFNLENIRDGLNGVRVRRKNSYGAAFEVSEGVFEFLYTKDQSGPVFDYDKAIFGKDNYFNHAQVRDGWSYFDRTIGTPFIPPTSDTNWRWPNFGDSFTSNNRVWVFHLGLKGTLLQKIEWSTKLSYSSNAGTHDIPFLPTPMQFSGILNLQSKVNWLGGGTMIFGSLAADTGDLYPVSYGVRLGLRKDGLLGQ